MTISYANIARKGKVQHWYLLWVSTQLRISKECCYFNLNGLTCFFFCLRADNELPTVTVPTTVPTIYVQPGMMNAAVMWSSSAIDVVDGTIPPADIICKDDSGNVVMSGDSFPVGTTTVTCRANDTALNEGSGQFTITVEGMNCCTLYHISCTLTQTP